MSALLTSISITREQVTTILARRRAASRAAALIAANSVIAPASPYIKIGTKEFLYALLITSKASHQEACEMLEVPPRTADGWRRRLRQAGKEYFGEEVEYEFLADYCTNEETRRIYEQIEREMAAESDARTGKLRSSNSDRMRRSPSPKSIS